jgi:lipoprotein signal peptidase
VTFVGLRLEDKGLAIGAGLYIGGGLCNLSELAWLGGVADYIPVFGYVWSLGDVIAFVGCLFAFPSFLKHGRRVWLARRSVSAMR